jgi:GxxExxY protein
MELLHHDLTQRIIGVYYDVYAELGHGFLERVCQQAMVIALRDAGLRVAERVPFPVMFRGELLGEFFADIVVNDLILAEIKATSVLPPWVEAQALNYLRASPLEVALIMNFGPKREYRRRILTNDRKTPASSVHSARVPSSP